MSISAASSVGAISTKSENKDWQKKVAKCNTKIYDIRAQIDVYLKKLEQAFINNGDMGFKFKAQKVANLLLNIKYMLSEINNLNVDCQDQFDVEYFDEVVLQKFQYLIAQNINLEHITQDSLEKIVDRTNEIIKFEYWYEQWRYAIKSNL